MAERIVEFQLGPEEAGLRLDRILVGRFAELGRKRARSLCDTGRVLVDGRAAGKGVQPRAGARITVTLGEPAQAVPQPGPLEVLLERPDLVVVNKPAGQPSAVVQATDRETLVNALVARYPEMASVGFGVREPGIIHRLDTQTSGALVAARTSEAFTALRAALENGKLLKRYLALVDSKAIDEQGVIEAWLGPHPKNPRRVAVYPEGHARARAARSVYRVIERRGRWALVEVEACRAYRHQVRMHLAWRGSPIAGDALYGGPSAALGDRHALHASQVSFDGPEPAAFDVRAPLPAVYSELLAAESP
jgi:23S rRNA pseudouridine1911/1915/1917 synthase